MSTAAAKRTNGKTPRAACVHSPGCPLVDEQRDLRVIVESKLDALHKALIEQQTTLQSSLMAQGETIDHDRAKWIDKFEDTQKETREVLKELGATVLALGREVRALGALVQSRLGQEG